MEDLLGVIEIIETETVGNEVETSQQPNGSCTLQAPNSCVQILEDN